MFLQLLQRNADYHPHDVAIVYGDSSISNLELLNRVKGLAHGLRSLGVGPGDRVALLLENSPDFIVSYYAVAACRGVNVPLNIDFKESEVEFYLGDSKAKCIIYDEQRAQVAIRAANAVEQPVSQIASGRHSGDAIPLAELIDTQSDEALPSSALDDDIVYIYTSGSTGRPKCAPRTVVQYWWEMNNVIECVALDHRDVIFCAIPLFHNFAAVQCMLAFVGARARLVILKSPNPFVLRRKEALAQLERERATIFPGVPYIFEQLCGMSSSADLSSVRICHSASAVLARETADAFYAKFQVPVREHYGCTEVGAMTINLDDDPAEHADSVGTPLPGVTVRILDDDGMSVAPGTIGEIVVSSRAMTRGYLGVDAKDNHMFRDGAFYTGDLGCLDEEGRLYLKGRKKLIIDVMGQKVSPIEVEDVLAEHPDIRDSVVIGVPDPKGNGQVVKAYVVANGECGSEDLMVFCRQHLANFKVPQVIEFISEVPKNTLGKVVRRQDEIERLLVQPKELEPCEEAL